VKTIFKYIAILLLFSKLVIAQNAVLGPESFNWFFGDKAAITFNTPDKNPKAIKGSLITEEGCATVSDAEGNLLFYASGETIWNRLNLVMKGGANMPGGFSSTQAVLILQKPGFNDLFYVFNTENLGGNLSYSIVDMSRDNGLGEVVAKGLFLSDNISEKLTAVYHENGEDIWLVVKEKNRQVFKSYLINQTGIILPAVESAVPVKYDLSKKYSSMGYLNFSPAGDKLAAASYSAGQFEIYDFDRESGKVSNPIVIKIPDKLNAYGVCFSPDGTKLYASYYDYDAFLTQFDLVKYDSAAIFNSKEIIAEYHDGFAIGAIQTGPDGKLYVSRYKSQFLSVINNPNAKGSNCMYEQDAIYLEGARTRLGLPNFTYVNKFVSSVPDLSFHNIYFAVGNMRGSPGDTTEKIMIFAQTLNDSIPANDINITATVEFDASAFLPTEQKDVISNSVVSGKRELRFNLQNVDLDSTLKKIIEFPGTILLPNKKNNEIRISNIDLKDTIFKVFAKHGFLLIDEVCMDNFRKVISIPTAINLLKNPVNNELEFDLISSQTGRFAYNIYSVNGLKVKSGSLYKNVNTIKSHQSLDIVNLTNGVFILEIKFLNDYAFGIFIKN